MKILIAGDWHSELHEEPVFKAFQELGHSTYRFEWYKYFKPQGNAFKFENIILKAQNKYMFGPVNNKLNKELIAMCLHNKVDVVFIYRGSHIYFKTLLKIRKYLPAVKIVGYNNDDPFSNYYPKWLWRHYIASLPYYDLVLAYRYRNIQELRNKGAKNVELLRSWFVPERNYPIKLSNEDKVIYECDVVFVGHYEDDGRVDFLKEIVNAGFVLKIWGPGYDWDPVLSKINELKCQIPVKLVWGEDYNKALSGAKIALCFFSTINRDTYTRRVFEIPATGVFMLSSYSDEMTKLFNVEDEVDLFITKEEMVDKIKKYCNNAELRERIASAGHKRVYTNGHDVKSRMSDVINLITKINHNA